MIKTNDCEKCIHKAICQYKSFNRELKDRILTEIDNTGNPEEVFAFTLTCLFYKEDKGNIKSDSPIIKANVLPFYCSNCSTNPKNGGSGMCNCTLGVNTIMVDY